MNQQVINTHVRVLRIAADVLNSKPTDWNAEGIGGDCAAQFNTVFHTLYEEGRVENDCLPIVVDVSACRDVSFSNKPSLDEIRIGIDYNTPILTAILVLSSPVIEHWASRT